MRPLALSAVFTSLLIVACQSSQPQSPSAPQESAPISVSSGQGASTCGNPIPPALYGINLKVNLGGSPRVLNATPVVGPDAAYCAQIGFAGSSLCMVRPIGSADRAACEELIWRRLNTPPTWHRDGAQCSGRAAGCEVAADNPYQVVAYASGSFSFCVGDVCGQLLLDQ